MLPQSAGEVTVTALVQPVPVDAVMVTLVPTAIPVMVLPVLVPDVIDITAPAVALNATE